ncbi:MAG TPA: hypothetical protein VNB64_10465 [Solirubrobacteraceae bacterium]|nr:hypothetical protein [Solirubrobacteraceae bacterium]
MGEHERQPSDARVESLLRACAPTPPPGFVADLQRRLLTDRAPVREPQRRRPLLLGGFAAAAAAAAVLLLSLAGAGPLGAGTEQDVRAVSKCRLLAVPGHERVPAIVQRRGAPPRVVYRRQSVRRLVTRC